MSIYTGHLTVVILPLCDKLRLRDNNVDILVEVCLPRGVM